MRPDEIGIIIAGFTMTGIDDVDLIDLAVFIPVVILEVYLTVGSLAGLNDQFVRTIIERHIAIVNIAAVVSILVLGGIGALHIEINGELAIALGYEIVTDTTIDEHAVHGLEILLVGNIVPHLVDIESLAVLVLVDKLEVGELHQDNQSAFRADILLRCTQISSSSMTGYTIRIEALGTRYALGMGCCRHQQQHGNDNGLFHIMVYILYLRSYPS